LNYFLTFFLFFVSIIVIACKAGANLDDSREQLRNFKVEAYQKLYGELTFSYNADSSYAVCVKNYGPVYGMTNIHFLVYNITLQQFIYEDRVGNAKITWLNPTTLKVEKIPGIVEAGKENEIKGYLYEVTEQKRISLKNNYAKP